MKSQPFLIFGVLPAVFAMHWRDRTSWGRNSSRAELLVGKLWV